MEVEVGAEESLQNLRLKLVKTENVLITVEDSANWGVPKFLSLPKS